mgnify:CR=1 FL=1
MAVVSDTLSPVEWAAMKIAGRAAEACRDQLAVGRGQTVDILLRVRGTVDVAADGVSHSTKAPSPEAVLATALTHVAAVAGQAAAQAVLEKVLHDLQALNTTKDAAAPYSESYMALAKSCVKQASVAREFARSGAVTGKLTLGVVKLEEVTAQVSAVLETATRIVLFEDEEKPQQKKLEATP